MKHYKARAISTSYWKPEDDYVTNIMHAVKNRLKNGDIIVVSEKAISTASGNIVDESRAEPRRTANFLARYWMRIIWSYVLGPLCHLRKETIQRLRNYPTKEGAQHKQVALQYAGLLQALMYGSEGGIDGSNLPYAYVSLMLHDAPEIAQKVRTAIKETLNKNVTVLIVDTDKTYSLGNFNFTPRPTSTRGIHANCGVLAYVAGQSLKLRKYATPIAVTDEKLSTHEALRIATIANRTRGSGAGRTVWDMAERFGVSLTQTTWEMLTKIEHKPIVIIRQ
ncbi:MAG TPA: coenzyme F420-0:L-glutamate ligase [Candidatus Bathyarchaeia archaeon]|nr:coenzyme F420-0:L-glutamate ligase [Candidatus Bathyarchaeia archaeon]